MSSMYHVFILKPAAASERQRALIGKQISRNARETTSSMYWVFILRLAKASERQRALIRKNVHIQKRIWNNLFDVLCFICNSTKQRWTRVWIPNENTFSFSLRMSDDLLWSRAMVRPSCCVLYYFETWSHAMYCFILNTTTDITMGNTKCCKW